MNKIALALLALVLTAPVSAQDDEQEDEVASLDEIKAGLEIGWATLQDCRASDMDCSNLEDAIGQLGLAAVGGTNCGSFRLSGFQSSYGG